MALQTASYLSGKISNIIFFERNGTYMARSMPTLVRQSTATKQRSTNFGIASSAGRVLRQQLNNSIIFPKDKKMQSRFSGAISKWLGRNNVADLQPANKLPFVNHFCFNEETSIAERFKVSITVMQPVADIIEVHIPAFVPTVAIAAPAHTVSVELIITAASCRLIDAASAGNHTIALNIPYNDEMVNTETLSFPVSTKAGSLVVTAAMMNFKLSNNKIDIRHPFLPSSVVDARYC